MTSLIILSSCLSISLTSMVNKFITLRYTVLHNTNLTIRIFWTKVLELNCFLKKKTQKNIPLVHKCNLTKRSFALHSFFLEPKTAYLKTLLYYTFSSTLVPNTLVKSWAFPALFMSNHLTTCVFLFFKYHFITKKSNLIFNLAPNIC